MTTFIVNQAFLIVIRYGIEGNKGWWADNLDMGGLITYVMEGDRWNRTSHHIGINCHRPYNYSLFWFLL